MPPNPLHRAVNVHKLRPALLNILSYDGGGRSLRVLLAVPPLSRQDHGLGGQPLRRIPASATSATVRSHSSAWWSVAMRKWCLGPCSPVVARYGLSKGLCTSSGGGEASVRPPAMEVPLGAALPPPPAATSPGEEKRGREGPQRAEDVVPMDDEVECRGGQEAPSVRPRATEGAERAQPKAVGVDTGQQWAKGWRLRADVCRFAHPQPPVPSRVHQD